MIKVFCNQCQNFIKDAITPKDIKDLKGDEICTACRDRNKIAFNEVERIQRAAAADINKKADEYKVMLDETIRKCLKGEAD